MTHCDVLVNALHRVEVIYESNAEVSGLGAGTHAYHYLSFTRNEKNSLKHPY